MPWQGAGLILGQLLLCNGWDLGWTPTVISQQHTLYISLICYYILLYSGPSQLQVNNFEIIVNFFHISHNLT